MRSEDEVRAEIRRLITEGNIQSHAPIDPNTPRNQPKKLLTGKELEQKVIEEEQATQTQSPNLRKVMPTPYADLLADQEALPDLIEQRVQAAYTIRDMVLALPDRVRKEILMAGGKYKPSRGERAWWRFQDDIHAVKDRASRFFGR